MLFFSGSQLICLKKNNIKVENYLKKTVGIASYYAHKFHNRLTASGEIYDMYDYTAAHKRISFGTIVKIVNLKNNKAVLVKINDRGPYVRRKIFDLSYRAAKYVDGLYTPKIKATYFNLKKVARKFDTNYFLGHSIYNDFVILHKDEVKFCDTIKNARFEEVMNTYLQYEDIPNANYYIFIKNRQKRKANIFYIGTPKIDSVRSSTNVIIK